MTTAVLSVLGPKAIDLAINKIEQLLADAVGKQKDGIERCEKYLEVCKEAILGLEQEYDEILVQAHNRCDTAEELKQLSERIDSYLGVDRLRPRLQDAIEGLSHYQFLLETDQKSFFVWPWKKANKERAISEFTETLKQLNTYLKRLSEYDLPCRSAGSGVGIEALFAIKRCMDDSTANPAQTIKELTTKYRNEREKEPMLESIKKIRSLIENLRWTFM